jgi:hypothetical protein
VNCVLLFNIEQSEIEESLLPPVDECSSRANVTVTSRIYADELRNLSAIITIANELNRVKKRSHVSSSSCPEMGIFNVCLCCAIEERDALFSTLLVGKH